MPYWWHGRLPLGVPAVAFTIHGRDARATFTGQILSFSYGVSFVTSAFVSEGSTPSIRL